MAKKNQESDVAVEEEHLAPSEVVDEMPVEGVDIQARIEGALEDSAVQEVLTRVEKQEKLYGKNRAKAAKPKPEPEESESAEADEEPEATDGDEEPQLDDQLAALAARYRIDPQLLEGMQSTDEANRFIDRMYQFSMREEGQHAAPMPPTETPQQTKVDAEIEELKLDLEAYDEDDPNRKNLATLLARLERAEKRNKELQEKSEREEQARAAQASQAAVQELFRSLSRQAPELFGTEKSQTQRQIRNTNEAIEMAAFLQSRLAERGIPFPAHDAMAEQVLRKAFSDELVKPKQAAKRAAVQEYAKRRSVGAPARAAQSTESSSSTAVWDGPREDDPELLRIVRGISNRRRG